MFKLIAIENENFDRKEIKDKRRYASIYRVLDQGELYYFCKGFVVRNGVVSQSSGYGITEKLYSEGEPQIDICAVVGENGSGKSSLIELYLRLMNNLAYVCHAAINGGKKYNTQFVDEIFSTVYFYDTDKQVSYAVRQHGAKLTYLRDGVEQFTHNYNKPIETVGFQQDVFPTPEKAKGCLEELCYTMVINYSAYSYNHEDYLPEWDTVFNNDTDTDKDTDTDTDKERTVAERMEDRCWIDSLFHKNDGYQLPIVINPFREDGMVDYNNERELTQDRLYSLTLLQSSPIITILNGKVLDRFVFDVDDDLNPTGNKTYSSYKVLSRLQMMGALQAIDAEHAYDVAEDFGKKIITAWSKCYGVDFASYAVVKNYEDGKKRDPHVLQALNYIVYKTLKIAQTYQKYQYYRQLDGDTKQVEEYVKNLFSNDRSHITQKIRRCMTFIVFRQYSGNEIQAEQLKRAIHGKYKSRKRLMSEARRNHPFERFYDVKEYDWIVEDFLPSPSFKVNLYLKSSEGRKQTMIGLSTMSSGERQFINSISTFAYHLTNIDSVWRRINKRTKEIGYRNICVFFDEMDLYLHPEYQTKMIQLMLQVIEELNLECVQSIQIICASHSPFILSDILSQNVMYLKKGRVYNNGKVRTFAANIGDLLCHSFFLSNGLIGCFARDKVKSLVDWLDPVEKFDSLELENENKEEPSKWNLEKAEEFVGLIDDPFVKKQLEMMLHDFLLGKELENAKDKN